MNVKTIHENNKAVSTTLLFKSDQAKSTAIRILKDEKLAEHSTKTLALLMCIEGKALYGTEKGVEEILEPGDYVIIEPLVKHWVEGLSESHLVLFR